MANLQRIEKLKQFLAADPLDSFTRYALALEYHGIGESERAIEALREVIERDPKYLPAYQQLGQICAAADRSGEAAAFYRRGIAIAAELGDTHAGQEMQTELDDLDGAE